MSSPLKKARKLLKDPLLFLADSPLLRDRVDSFIKRRGSGAAPAVGESFFGNIKFPAGFDFVVYFSNSINLAYQVEQWLPALNKLAETNSLLILTRTKSAYRHFSETTKLRVGYCKTLDDLMGFYERFDVGCVIYVNNSVKNFQSLITHRSMHVHINHGESEKSSMYSNQAKAYDYVFVVAQAGLDRYKKHLMKIDESKFVQVGRPQLDGIKPIKRKLPAGAKVVLYAPTWAATHASMNYSSIADHGVEIARQFVGNDDYYFIYRPHPSAGTNSEEERIANEKIQEMVAGASNASMIMDVDINRIFPRIDIAIFDNSSVIIDYLKVDKPFLLTDYFRGDIPLIADAGMLLEATHYEGIASLVDQHIQNDPKSPDRTAMKSYYLGEFSEGESTKLFIDTLLSILSENSNR